MSAPRVLECDSPGWRATAVSRLFSKYWGFVLLLAHSIMLHSYYVLSIKNKTSVSGMECIKTPKLISARAREAKWQSHWSLNELTHNLHLHEILNSIVAFPKVCAWVLRQIRQKCGLWVPRRRKRKNSDGEDMRKVLLGGRTRTGMWCVCGGGGHSSFLSCLLSIEYSLATERGSDPCNSVQKSRESKDRI